MTERAVAAREHGGRSRGPLISRPELDPLWYKDAIIYQLHVKTFRDSTGDGIGDFRGLTERLDYIRDLGVTAIWVQPFYPSPLRDDGYDIGNYHDVHPDYGTLADFKQFLREAHRRKLQVITELVINHTSDTHPWFQAARRAPPGSSKRNYYVWSADDRKWPETRIIFTDTESSNWTWDPVAEGVLLAPLLLAPAGPELRQSQRPQGRHQGDAVLVRHGRRRDAARRHPVPQGA